VSEEAAPERIAVFFDHHGNESTSKKAGRFTGTEARFGSDSLPLARSSARK
jgi:hypothetical protein